MRVNVDCLDAVPGDIALLALAWPGIGCDGIAGGGQSPMSRCGVASMSF